MARSPVHHPVGAGRGVLRLLLPFLLSRLGLAVAGALAIALLSMQPGGWHASPNAWLDMWARWDSGFYLDIARHGYAQTAGGLPRTSFFPLYPLLMRLFALGSRDTQALALVGAAISNASTLLALWLLYRLLALDRPEATARRAVWALILFPTSFFLSAVYTEGPFLLFTVAAFWCARRGRWWASGLLGALAAGTRSLGVLLVLPLFLEWRAAPHRRRGQWLWLLLVPLGLLAYMTYLQVTFGDALMFVKVQDEWGRATTLAGAAQRLRDLVGGDVLARLPPVALEAAFALLGLGLLVMVIRRQRASYAAYTACALALPLGTLQLLSMPRMLIVAFPLFTALADWLSRRRLYWPAMGVCYAVQVFLFVRWALWYWVA